LPTDIRDGVHHQIVDTIIEPLFRQLSMHTILIARRPPAQGYHDFELMPCHRRDLLGARGPEPETPISPVSAERRAAARTGSDQASNATRIGSRRKERL
jgi:hypothetical protein